MRKIQLKLLTGQPHDSLIIKNDKGDVENQEFWQGQPKKLVGFVKSKGWKVFDLDYQTFYNNPFLAVGKYPIFANNQDDFYISAIVKEANVIQE